MNLAGVVIGVVYYVMDMMENTKARQKKIDAVRL